MDNVNRYLAAGATSERLQLLKQWSEERASLPLDLARDLLSLPLQSQEHNALLRCADSSDKIAFEDFLTKGMFGWQQNVASIALWEWALRSDGLLWHRTYALSFDPHIPQRVSYTLLDLAWASAGGMLVEQFAQMKGVEDMSAAFLALLFHRALQWNIKNDRLLALAENYLNELNNNTATKDRTVPYALSYILRFSPDTLRRFNWSTHTAGIWPDITRSLLNDKVTNDWQKAFKLKTPQKALEALGQTWPALWLRHSLSPEHVHEALSWATGIDWLKLNVKAWEIFAGIPSATLRAAAQKMEHAAQIATAVKLLGNLLAENDRATVLQQLRDGIAAADDPAAVLANLAQRDRVDLNQENGDSSVFGRILRERRDLLNGHLTTSPLTWELSDQKSPLGEMGSRIRFINLAYRNLPESNFTDENHWERLGRAWSSPSEDQIEQLAKDARQAQPIFQVCFIDTLGKFRGVDKAALKLLDFVRSSEEVVIRAVIRALSGIGTPRAHQEMVAFLTRPNINIHMQMEIAQLLKNADLSTLQAELRSAITDLKVDNDPDGGIQELKEALTALLHPEANTALPSMPTNAPGSPSTNELEALLMQKIPDYAQLSSEAKRALRTAQFFHLQVASAGNSHTIDLSPAIDMQYKALELTFREWFEEPVGQLLRIGVVQRKLDVIGYARPIPDAMDEFENYIESLPVINTIPFFSRFKLRKMLRAMCQFRAGKRFTLDGLKAFALFFICFSRKQCRYNLENLFSIPAMSDQEIAEFCKALHVFQDFRNRAAHEGFHPDASNNLDGIWRDTANIVAHAVKVKTSWEQGAVGYATPVSSANAAVVVKKVS